MLPTMNKTALLSTLIIYLNQDAESIEEMMQNCKDKAELQEMREELKRIDEYINNLHFYFIEETKKGE